MTADKDTLFAVFLVLMGVATVLALIFDHWADRAKHKRFMRMQEPQDEPAEDRPR